MKTLKKQNNSCLLKQNKNEVQESSWRAPIPWVRYTALLWHIHTTISFICICPAMPPRDIEVSCVCLSHLRHNSQRQSTASQWTAGVIFDSTPDDGRWWKKPSHTVKHVELAVTWHAIWLLKLAGVSANIPRTQEKTSNLHSADSTCQSWGYTTCWLRPPASGLCNMLMKITDLRTKWHGQSDCRPKGCAACWFRLPTQGLCSMLIQTADLRVMQHADSDSWPQGCAAC